MKSYTTLLILIFLLTSCIKEYTSINNVYICNQSSENLKLEYYRYGQVQENMTVVVKSKECINVFSARGRGSTPTYGSEIINMDSAIVIFEDSTKLVHYGYFQKNGTNPNSYPNYHPRNIFPGDSIFKKDDWVLSILSKTKHSKSTEHRYTFREEDYLFAKK